MLWGANQKSPSQASGASARSAGSAAAVNDRGYKGPAESGCASAQRRQPGYGAFAIVVFRSAGDADRPNRLNAVANRQPAAKQHDAGPTRDARGRTGLASNAFDSSSVESPNTAAV